jgi:2-aminoadipate transaminase
MKSRPPSADSALSALGRRTTEPAISWLMKAALEHPKLISLAAGFTDNATLPVAEALELARDVLKDGAKGRSALQYGATGGDPLLRRITAQDLQALDTGESARAHLPGYEPGRVLITHGSQQMLYILTEALCDPGDIVLVEDPTYFVFLGILQSRGIRARGIRMTDGGIDLAHLESVLGELKRGGELPRVKLLYLVSYFQNPTGITTNLATKRAALDLLKAHERAAKHPLYLLEDAAYRELRFAGEDVPSALTCDAAHDRVLYTGTYSKPFATGIRVGFGVLPEPVLTTALRIKGNHDFGTANFLQQLLARAITTGAYERHLQTLAGRYARKAAAMTRAIARHFPDSVTCNPPRGGLSVWARAPRRLKTGPRSAFCKAALDHDVLYVPGELCYADDPARRKPGHEMRLSFGSAGEADIRTGIERLGKLLHGALD